MLLATTAHASLEAEHYAALAKQQDEEGEIA